MKRKLKKELRAAFEAPAPTDKERFLKQLRYPKITYREFLLEQLLFIRKRIWLASALLVWIGWFIVQYQQTEAIKIWSISALLPFLAMLTVTELCRSAACHMAELEGSCRFSLPQLSIARLSILGAVNFVVLLLLLIFLRQASAYSLLQTVLYTMVPYLAVCAVCLWLLNRVRGTNGIYACGAAAGLVSAMGVILGSKAEALYSAGNLNSWAAVFTVGLILTGFQMYKFVKQMEDKKWSLCLIE
jgi:hypothetical protein